ncbi:MAG TPA: hypothetical protein VFE78_03800, partial [Gemmataceae bacterium]|nr:hypothetical protein [Gemmataceae bacterium]
MSEATSHREVLAAQSGPGGGWGYAPEQPAHLEPTCLALLALAREPRFGSEVGKAKDWLRQCAADDGTYRLERGREEAVWPTALVLFVQSALGGEAVELERTAAALLARKGRQTDPSPDDDVNDIDLKLNGWPWAEGNFSWV